MLIFSSRNYQMIFISAQFHVVFSDQVTANSEFSSNFSRTDSKLISQTYAAVSSVKLQISISFSRKNKSFR